MDKQWFGLAPGVGVDNSNFPPSAPNPTDTTAPDINPSGPWGAAATDRQRAAQSRAKAQQQGQ